MNNKKTTDNQIYDLIIIGGGASGLFAAATAPAHVKGLILEKTAHPGSKLLMSGNGQCNITHSGSIKEFVSCYGDAGKKIRSCLYKHSNLALIDFLDTGGVKTFTRENGKVFPASMNARDVLDMLLAKSAANGFEIRTGCQVTGIQQSTATLWQVGCGNVILSDNAEGGNVFLARSVIIATGGCSYPASGSDGSMFKVLEKDLNIEITELKPALSSIQVNQYPYGELSGISFENAGTSIWRKDKKIAETHEALLLTHKDLSGPAVINISKYAEAGDTLKVNYLYPMNYEQVFNQFNTAVHGSKSSVANIMSLEFNMPKRLCQVMTDRYGEGIKKLSTVLTGESFIINSVSGFSKAMATSGGINLRQLDTGTFEFKEYPGLYAIGEALDVDGITGGYNLQFAFSSGRSAVTALFY